MCYLNTIEYEIKPIESYKIIRNCPKCKDKSRYINTNRFRINANGKRLDIWLIYHCEVCKHTSNLSLYSRIHPSDLTEEALYMLSSNDPEMALYYGTQKTLFSNNHAVLADTPIGYTRTPQDILHEWDLVQVVIKNPYEIKIKVDQIMSEILDISRTKVKTMLKNQSLFCDQNYLKKETCITLLHPK